MPRSSDWKWKKLQQKPTLLWQGWWRLGRNEDFTVTNLRTGSSFSISNDNSNGGWLVGAGVEWAFAANWSAKVEYNYLGLEDRTFTVPAGSPFFPGDIFTRGTATFRS